MEKQHKTIVTHNGTFHNDEVTAYAMLNYIFPNNTLIRTRDPSIINDDDTSIVIDVGQIYDVKKHRYDHHQPTFHETFDTSATPLARGAPNFQHAGNSSDQQSTIPLSSAGLIYKHFGHVIFGKFCAENNFEFDSDIFKKAHTYFYNQFFVEIDAFDNGVRQYSDNFYGMIESGEIEQKYYATSNIGYYVSKFNCINVNDDALQYEAFKRASNFAWGALYAFMMNYFSALKENADDYDIIEMAMRERHVYDKSGRIVVIKTDCNSWRQCIGKYEYKHPEEVRVNFVIYPHTGNTWSIRTMSDQRFKNRKDLLAYDDMIKKVTKPAEITFIHTKRFIGAATTLETCIEMGMIS